NGNDIGQIRSIGTRIDATASAIPFVHITGQDPGVDVLAVNMLGGNDVLDASDLAAPHAAPLITLTVTGRAGNHTLTGTEGLATFVWSPGDGSDTIDSGGGEDTMVVNGSDLAERFDLSASGGRARVTRDVDGSSVSLGGGIDTITVDPLGGADTVTV